jgi:hypothetical protein
MDDSFLVVKELFKERVKAEFLQLSADFLINLLIFRTNLTPTLD